MKPWPTVRLGEVLTHYTEYIEAPEPREYRKLTGDTLQGGENLRTGSSGIGVGCWKRKHPGSGSFRGHTAGPYRRLTVTSP